MRTISFEVPAAILHDFTSKLVALDLENSITGRNDDDEIEVDVYYEKSESDKVDELEEYLNEIKEQYYEELEDEDDEESDDEE